MKKIFAKILINFLFLNLVFLFYPVPKALAVTCSASINFDANPKQLDLKDSLTISGTIHMNSLNPPGSQDAGYCYVGAFNTVVKSLHLGILNDASRSLFDQDYPIAPNINFSQTIKLGKPGDYTAGSIVKLRAVVTAASGSSAITVLATSGNVPITILATLESHQTYACVAGNGRYACGTGNLSDCSDIANKEAVCGSNPCVLISSQNLCGTVAPTQTDTYQTCIAANKGVGYCTCFYTFTQGTEAYCQANAASFVCPDGKTPIPSDNSDCPSTTGSPPTGGSPGGTSAGDSLINFLPKDNLTDMIIFIMQGFLGIIGVWAVVFIVIGGFRMVMAAGSEEQYTAAKKTITWAILGLVIAVLSFSIIAIVQNLIGAKVQ